MIIGIDFDGTIADTNSEKAAWIKSKLAIEIEPYMCDRTCCVPIIGESQYEIMSREVYSDRMTRRLKPVSSVLEVVAELQHIHQVFVITVRAGSMLETALEWLARYKETCGLKCFGMPTTPVSKAEICVREGAKVLVDDDERHVYRAVSNGLIGILFKNSAPTSFERKGLQIYRSWKEVKEVLQ